MKTVSFLIITIATMLALSPIAVAAPKPKPSPAVQRIPCYFFQKETLKLSHNCIIQGWVNADGGDLTLTWENGKVTQLQSGLQKDGKLVCPYGFTSVDRVCRKNYERSATSLKRISSIFEAPQRLSCFQVKDDSICIQF